MESAEEYTQDSNRATPSRRARQAESAGQHVGSGVSAEGGQYAIAMPEGRDASSLRDVSDPSGDPQRVAVAGDLHQYASAHYTQGGRSRRHYAAAAPSGQHVHGEISVGTSDHLVDVLYSSSSANVSGISLRFLLWQLWLKHSIACPTAGDDGKCGPPHDADIQSTGLRAVPGRWSNCILSHRLLQQPRKAVLSSIYVLK